MSDRIRSFAAQYGIPVGSALLAFIVRVPHFLLPIGMDEADYWLRSDLWLRGHRLYGEIEAGRGPLLHAVFAVLAKFVRTTGVDPGVALRVSTAIAVALTVGIMVYALQRLFSPAAAAVGGAFEALLLAQPALESTQSNAEMWLLLPYAVFTLLILALALGTDEWDRGKALSAFAAGAALALALFIKQQVVFAALLPLLLIVLDVSRKRLWTLVSAYCCAGGIAVTLVVLLWMQLLGDLGPFLVFWSAPYLFYAAAPLEGSFMAAAAPVLRSMQRAFLLPVAALSFGMASVWPRQERQRRALVVLLAWFALNLLMAVAPRRLYAHYFVLLLPAAGLLAAWVFWAALSSSTSRRRVALAVLALGGASLVVAYVSGVRGAPSYAAWSDYGPVAGRMIARNTRPGEKVFVWGAANAPLVYGRRDQDSQVMWVNYPFRLYGESGREVLGVHLVNTGDRIISEWARREPEYVLLSKPLFAPETRGLNAADDVRVAAMIDAALKRDYQVVASAKTYFGPMDLWRLRRRTR